MDLWLLRAHDNVHTHYTHVHTNKHNYVPRLISLAASESLPGFSLSTIRVTPCLSFHPAPQVLTVDARNHGDSPHSPDASYEAMSQDLQGLLPQLGLVPCVVVGHSMGGKTAMLLALQRVSCIYLGLPHPALPTLRALLIMWDTSAPWMARLQQLCWGPSECVRNLFLSDSVF